MGQLDSPESKQLVSSLPTKIIFWIFIATFSTAMAVSWVPLYSIQGQLRDSINDSFPVILNRSIARVSRTLNDGLNEVSQATQSAVGLRSHHGTATSVNSVTDLLERLRISSHLEGFILFDANQTPQLEIGALPFLTDEAYAELARHQRSEVYRLSGIDETAIVATVPVRNEDGITAGYLHGFYRFDVIEDLLLSDALGPTGEIYLVATSGEIVSHTLSRPVEKVWKVSEEAISRKGRAEVRSYMNYAGQYVVGSARPLGHLDVVMVVEQNYEDTFKTVFAMSRRVIVIDIVMVLIFSFIGYRVTKTVMQPIYSLSDGAHRITQGDLDVNIPEPKARDELHLLTVAFNEMTRRLREGRAEIESINSQLQDQNVELHYANDVLERISITDGLTQAYNHRFFQDHLAQEVKRVDRSGDSLSMLLLDIDDFKALNDKLGHSAGDQILSQLSGLLRETVRESDLVARYGGEEFAITTHATGLDGAQRLAEKIRTLIDEHEFSAGNPPQSVHVTVSIGIAEYKGDRKNFFERTDRALYRAKDRGKNCVVTDVETYC